MDRRQFSILIGIIIVCIGSAAHYLDNEGSGAINILFVRIKVNIIVRFICLYVWQVVPST